MVPFIILCRRIFEKGSGKTKDLKLLLQVFAIQKKGNGLYGKQNRS